MTLTTIPFDLEQVNDPKQLFAIVEAAHGPPPAFSGPHHAGGYGAAIWGGGTVRRIWGAGYAPSGDILRFHAVKRILEEQPEGMGLKVFSKGILDQLRHAAGSNGYRADGKTPFFGYDIIKPVHEARERGDWQLSTFKTRGEPEGHEIVRQLAAFGLAKAKLLSPAFEHLSAIHGPHFIYATDSTPDPDGLGAALNQQIGPH